MDHIFGDSHDIDFGGPSNPSKEKGRIQPKEQNRSFSPGNSRNGHYTPSDHPRRRRDDIILSPANSMPPDLGEVVPLTRLISSMKPSFFPKEDDASAIRLVSLSPSNHPDPLMLLTRDDVTILIGSGFDSIIRAGKTYPTFPDMRLVFSEKEHIAAWILTDENIDIAHFLTILPSLEFPPIYASRNIIAKFRNSISNTSFLEKCRFFELFSGELSERRIGNFELSQAANGGKGCFLVRSAGIQLGFDYITVSGASNAPIAKEQILKKDTESFSFGDENFTVGEILIFRGKNISKHSLKFTFDTFFLDAGSVGVVAGYTLSDREILASNGILTFTLEEDTRARTIAGHIFIDSRGFVHSHEMMAVHKEILKGIRATYEKLILENERIERGELVQSLRREITKYCYVLTGRTPVVMPIVIERG